jgi:hypothetical protein
MSRQFFGFLFEHWCLLVSSCLKRAKAVNIYAEWIFTQTCLRHASHGIRNDFLIK